MSDWVEGSDGRKRCRWSAAAPQFESYHDEEWGFPVDCDRMLYEKICLESFQSGLSWRTILSKRESFRRAFKNFEFEKVARFTEKTVQKLLADEAIVRHRGKIEATINNAQRACEMVEKEGSIAAFVWRYEPVKETKPQTQTTSPEAKAFSKELKRRGWKFVGPTTAYAFMQAMGLVNDHASECVIRDEVIAARAAFKKPGEA